MTFYNFTLKFSDSRLLIIRLYDIVWEVIEVRLPNYPTQISERIVNQKIKEKSKRQQAFLCNPKE